MNFATSPSFGQGPELTKEWKSLATRMARSHRGGSSADASSEELHGAYGIEAALQQIEKLGRHLSSPDITVQAKAAHDILQIYSSEENGLRHDIRFQAGALAANREGGSEPFAFAARLMIAASTTIALAAQRAGERAVLNEIKASLDAAVSGLERAGRKDADVLAVVLRRQLSWLFT